MVLPLQTYNQLVQNQIAAIQSISTQLIDFSNGSILNALVQSNAGNSIWIQGLISSLLAITRLQTSEGNDVDTFINQFGFFRPAAVAANGNVTFSRTLTNTISYIPANSTLVQTSVGQIQFTTVVDTSNPAYDPTTNSYLMGLTVSSVTVPVVCLTPGTTGNVASAAIDTIVSTLTNVNTVTNADPCINGANSASDTATKSAFVAYLAGLSKATYAAVASAVMSIAGVTRYLIIENVNESNVTQLGYFFVVVDNGLGTISMDVVTAVSNAVNLVRGLSIQFNIDAATPTAISTVSATIHVPVGTTTATKNAITATINANLIALVASLNVGTTGTLYYSKLSQIMYEASSIITGIDSILLNSGTSDVSPSTNLEVLTLTSGAITLTYTSP